MCYIRERRRTNSSNLKQQLILKCKAKYSKFLKLNGIFGSILLLIVILFLGPLFQTLPNACLASIIVVALKNMAMEFTIFPQLYKKSRLEAVIFIKLFDYYDHDYRNKIIACLVGYICWCSAA